MTIIDVFFNADRNSYGKATQYLIITGLVSISPLLLTIATFLIIQAPIDLFDFLQHGEAGICAIGILLWAGILVARELKPPFAHRSFFQVLCFFLWAFSIIIYISVRISSAKAFTISNSALIWSSLTLLAFSLIFGWLVVLIDAVRESLNPQEVRKQQINDLTENFKGLKDE